MLCLRSIIVHITVVGRYIWLGVGGYCPPPIFLSLFLAKIQNKNLDKEIQCKQPCWDDKTIRSDVFRNEMLMSFMLDFFVHFP